MVALADEDRKVHRSTLLAFTIVTVWIVLCTCVVVALYTHHNATLPMELPFHSYAPLFNQIGSIVIAKDGNKVYRQNEIVVTTRLSGATKPSGRAAASVFMDKGRVGVAVKLLKRNIIEVRWLEQEWSLFPSYWKKVTVPSFSSAINIDRIAPIGSGGSRLGLPPYSPPTVDWGR